MANLTFNKAELEKNIKVTEENLEKIRMLGIPIEISGKEVNIEVLPNRPDLLSLQGFLRAVKAYFGKEPGLKRYKVNNPDKNYKVIVDPSVKLIRPYTACAIVKNLILDEDKIKTIIDLQEKLHTTLGRNRKKMAIGIYPMEKITLPITYSAKKPDAIKFAPLEEKNEMSALEILNKNQKGKEYAHLLKEFDKYPVFTDSSNKILSLVPIINSNETGKVTSATKEVFIECSGTHFQTISKTLNIIVTTLSEMGGKIYSMDIKYDHKITNTPDLSPQKIKISLDNVNNLLGIQLKEKDLEKLLPKMGYDCKNLTVSIPAWRTDIFHEVDIIEDIGIAYGYDNFIPTIPSISTIGEENREEKIKNKLSELLIGLNLNEISSYHLIKQDEEKKVNIKEGIEVENSKTEYKILRPNLIIPALRILAENKDHEYPQNIFEIGKVFSKDANNKSESGVKEEDNLIIACCPGSFTQTKQILDYITRNLGTSYSLKESYNKNLIEGRAGSIILESKEIGYIGEIHPETLIKNNIKMPISVIEISLDEIYHLLKNNKKV